MYYIKTVHGREKKGSHENRKHFKKAYYLHCVCMYNTCVFTYFAATV